MTRTLTDTEARDLGLRLVAWLGDAVWREGMAGLNPTMPNLWYPRVGRERRPQFPFLAPDMSDDSTRGAVLGILRELYGCQHLSIVYSSDEQGWTLWYDYAPDGAPWDAVATVYLPTEAEALVHYIEAAPRREG